ncbi:MAG: RIP metalloprotease RseP [Bacteroidales bacterium]|nr:RIP metalloprotease RseP [Bacteroidales bacterium]
MSLLIKIGQLLLSLSILIILHELGHFIFARIFKTRVEKFYLFFDPWFSLFKVKKGDTEYGIGWLPLGGYVKISGMIDESMDKEAMKQPPQPWEFRVKPAWQRLLIMLGGVMVNLFLGFLIYTFILFTWGERYLPNENLTDGIWVTDSIMHDIGFETGDKIISIDGKKPGNFSGILEDLFYGGEVVVKRNGKDTAFQLPENFAERVIDNDDGKNRGPLIYPRIPFIISEVSGNSINSNAGLEVNDRVIGLDDYPIMYADQVPPLLDSIKGDTIRVLIERMEMDKGQVKSTDTLSLKLQLTENRKMQVAYYGLIGYDVLDRLGVYTFVTKEYGFFPAIPAGFVKAKEKLQSYIRQFKLIFNFDTGAYKGVGGFGSITKLFPPVWDWQSFWGITAFLSLMLAFLNILPIPALDGGHVMFLLYEIITGRKPGDKFMEYAQIVGMFLLLFLLLYANGNDVYKWILHLIGK